MFKRKQPSEATNTKVKQTKTTSEPWKKVFSEASAAFKQNKFQDAASLFTRALTLNPNNSTILDCRSACYENLKEFDLALRDAATIIKLVPTESRGYLRAGKIFSIQKNYKKAVQIYTRALTKVNPQDKRYKQITDMKDKAEKKEKSLIGHDFMKILPYDVISSIFSLLSFDRRIQCTGVSTTWRNFALNWSGMWRDLDFGNRKISHALIKKYMAYAKGRHVRRFAMLDADQNMMRKIFQLLIDENCQYIETLDLVRCEIPLTMLLRMLRLVGKHVKNIRFDEGNLDVASIIVQVLPYCPQLTQLSMIGLETGTFDNLLHNENSASLNQLTHLRLSINGRDNARWLLWHCKNLNLLDFYSPDVNAADIIELLLNDNFEQIENFYFTSSGTSYNIKTQWMSTMPSSVKTLTAFAVYGDPSFTGQMLELLINKYHKSLQHLVMQECQSMDNTLARMAIAPGLPSIETIHIPGAIAFEEWNLHSIITSCPTLQDVDISRNSDVTDSVLSDLGQVTKKLKRLNISHCSYVTGVGLQQIIKTHKSSLEKLVLNNCQRINADAVTWAQSILGKSKVECKFK